MNNSSSNSHRRVEHSTTLNRKYVKRPTPRVRPTAEIHAENLKRRQALAARMNRERMLSVKQAPKKLEKTKKIVRKVDSTPIKKVEKHPLEITARKRLSLKNSLPVRPIATMKEKKEQAISQVLEKMQTANPAPEKRKLNKSFFNARRVTLALFCAIFVVGASIYLINLSMPSISVRVAAMQSGLDAVYPSFIPKDFSLSNVNTESEKITMAFKSTSNETFVITEEKSSWNSSALESNYIKPNYKNNYSTIREQGLTIYISDTNCAWVNGGKLFTISSSNLSKTQLTSIATSL